MTTIATDGRTMAAESMVSAGGNVVAYTAKVFKAADGRIYATCGDSDAGQLFAKWIDGKVEKPELGEDFSALILALDGKVYWIGKNLEPVEYMVPTGIGSGGDLAIGAMLAGASPEQAVEIACQRDNGSGGPITSISLPATLEMAA